MRCLATIFLRPAEATVTPEAASVAASISAVEAVVPVWAAKKENKDK